MGWASVSIFLFNFTCLEKRGLEGSLVLLSSAVLFAKGALTEHSCQFPAKHCYCKICSWKQIGGQIERDRRPATQELTTGKLKGTRRIVPGLCKILFYLRKLRKTNIFPHGISAMVVFYKSLPQGRLESFSIHVRCNVTFHFQSKGNKKLML